MHLEDSAESGGALPGEAGEITRGLAALRRGDAGALERVVPMLYDDLRRLARNRLRGERDGHTLDTTGLVHEAYLRLATQRRLAPADRGEFFAAAPPLLAMSLRETEALTRLKRFDSAEELLAAARRELAEREPQGSLDTASGEVALGRLRLAQQKASEAVAAFRRAVALRERLLPADSELLAEARAELGQALFADGEVAEGKRLMAASLPRFASWSAAHSADVARLREALDTAR